MRNLDHILTKFEEFVSPNFCNELAKASGFVQRSTSQLKGYEFAQAMMIPNAFLEAETLNSLAIRMHKINKECNLSASALAQRINSKEATVFMRACFSNIHKQVVDKNLTSFLDVQVLSKFYRVLIEDSTKAELNEKLSPHFKGSGGLASKASLKIDYIFDYLSEGIVDIDFYSGNKPDQSLAGRLIPMLKPNDLVIRDLGYFVLKYFKGIEEAGGYYISRWKVNEDVYGNKEDTKPLDLGRFIDKHKLNGVVDKEVFIGKSKHPVRLVACLMDEEGINKRLRAANKSAQKRGREISKKKASLLKYSIFITNIPATILSSQSIMAIYRVRWRIELIFKQWKSCLKIHLFKGYNIERFYCFLYGRLIMILLFGLLSPPLMDYAFSLGRELSTYKLVNYLIADHGFAIAYQEGKLKQFMEKLLGDLPRRLCMDKRKRSSLREKVRICNNYYREPEGKNIA